MEKAISRAGQRSGKAVKQLEEENERLKKIVAELSLDKPMLPDVIKNVVKAPPRRAIVNDLKKHYAASERRACGIAGIARGSLQLQELYRSTNHKQHFSCG